MVSPAFAQTPPGPVQAVELDFNIPAQSLTTALALFGQQSGAQITSDGDMVRNLSTPGVRSRMTAGDALRQLLAGTGLTYSVTSTGTFTVQKAPSQAGGDPGIIALGPVRVEGRDGPPSTGAVGNLPPPYAGGQVATGAQVGLLGNHDVMDTPFNLTSYTDTLVIDQQARTISDVLINDPSVGVGLPRNATRDQPFIRGFSLVNTDTGFNGLYGLSGNYSFAMLDGIARVDVLKGLDALLDGMSLTGDVGGRINLITKRADDTPLTEFTAGYASSAQFGGHVDIGRRFGDESQFGVRFNGSFRDGDVELDRQSQRLGFASLGLDYRGERMRLSADLVYESTRNQPGQARTSIDGGLPLPKPPDPASNWMPPWSDISDRNLLGMLQGEFDIAERVTTFGSFGASDNEATPELVNPFVSDRRGDFSGLALIQPTHWRNIAGQAGVRAAFDTGPIGHELVVNLAVSDNDTEIGRTIGATVSSNIYNPVFGPEPNLPYPRLLKSGTNDLQGYSVADTLSAFDKRIQLSLGVRRQEIQADSYAWFSTGELLAHYDSGAWTPAFTLVLKPLKNVSVYANYIEGLAPGQAVDSGFANAGQLFAPFRSTQYEAGIKVDWGGLTTTLSLFQIEQPNLIAVDAAPLPIETLDGQQRNRGIEFDTFGEIAPGVRLLGGFMLLAARQTQTEGGVNEGNKVVGIPDFQLNLGAEWDLPFVPGFTVTGRVIHTGSEFADSGNTLPLPAWTRFDLGARYSFDPSWTEKPVVIRVSVENIANNSYWTGSASDNQIFLGAPRTFLLSATFDF